MDTLLFNQLSTFRGPNSHPGVIDPNTYTLSRWKYNYTIVSTLTTFVSSYMRGPNKVPTAMVGDNHNKIPKKE